VKNKQEGGFSLIEVVVGIAVLGLVTAPVCASLLLSVRMNSHSQALMNARLQASGVVETLLAEGIDVDAKVGEGENETETEVYEKDVFDPSKRFHTSTFSIGEEWSSVLLQFDGSRTVEEKQYIVVRINNNCYVDSSSEEEGEKIPAVSFTFNYLLFHITNAHKK
jgi:prepilin-type N-terminal cleavage/methylation domain-containing protein